jgi:hypothetical protein
VEVAGITVGIFFVSPSPPPYKSVPYSTHHFEQEKKLDLIMASRVLEILLEFALNR